MFLNCLGEKQLFYPPQPLMLTSDERCVTDAALSCIWLKVRSHWPRISLLLVCICTLPVWADKLVSAPLVALHHCWLLGFHHQSLELTLGGNRLLLLKTIASKCCQCERLLQTNITYVVYLPQIILRLQDWKQIWWCEFWKPPLPSPGFHFQQLIPDPVDSRDAGESVCVCEIWWVFVKPGVNGQSGWMKV